VNDNPLRVQSHFTHPTIGLTSAVISVPVHVGITFKNGPTDGANHICETGGLAAYFWSDAGKRLSGEVQCRCIDRISGVVSLDGQVVNRKVNWSGELDAMIEPRRNRLGRFLVHEFVQHDLTVGEVFHLSVLNGNDPPRSLSEVVEHFDG